jgi:hypothetical protein
LDARKKEFTMSSSTLETPVKPVDVGTLVPARYEDSPAKVLAGLCNACILALAPVTFL